MSSIVYPESRDVESAVWSWSRLRFLESRWPLFRQLGSAPSSTYRVGSSRRIARNIPIGHRRPLPCGRRGDGRESLIAVHVGYVDAGHPEARKQNESYVADQESDRAPSGERQAVGRQMLKRMCALSAIATPAPMNTDQTNNVMLTSFAHTSDDTQDFAQRDAREQYRDHRDHAKCPRRPVEAREERVCSDHRRYLAAHGRPWAVRRPRLGREHVAARCPSLRANGAISVALIASSIVSLLTLDRTTSDCMNFVP